MKEFNSTKFVNVVKNYKKTVVHDTSDSQVKYLFCQLVKDNGFDCAQVLCFLYETWEKTYPASVRQLNKRKWGSIYKHYIQEAEAAYDWELAEKYQIVLDGVSSKGKEREEELKTKFFNIISEIGLDPILMELDMTLDLWGWMKTLDLVLSMDDKKVEICEEIVVKETMEDYSSSDTSIKEVVPVEATVEKLTETAAEKKIKKTRKRVKYLEIQQYSLDGKLVGSFSSITEAAKSGNYNHASISKNVNGVYRTAEGFRWVGITEQAEESKNVA